MNQLCWIRRDLRLHDHAALSDALEKGETTIVFVFDPLILNKLKDTQDRRVTFIYQSLEEMEKEVQKKGSSIIIRYGDPVEEIPKLAQELKVSRVVSNRDYEPYAKDRDTKVGKRLAAMNIAFEQFKDSVFYEKREVLTNTGGIYKVFTPYKNKWIETFESHDKIISNFSCDLKKLREFKNPKSILNHNWYQDIGFIETPPLLIGGTKAGLKRLENFEGKLDGYKEDRNFPAIKGTSYLSVYIRHGNISIRDMVRMATSQSSEGARTWLSEIIWRDFYQMILDTHPYIVKEAFKREYDQIKWLGEPKHFKAWCEGETGFPIIDAAMRCFNQTGMMHNRLRMVVASFLCKTLLIDWRKGEQYFAEKLLDYDLAANNGGWQWSSSSGCDAQPYFRIFNPYSQSEKFDPKGEFIRQWVPELAHLSAKEIHQPDLNHAPDYPLPIVSYELNRQRCLTMYSVVKNAK
ncbi:cryptochrome/photolyase family protein [Peredibacter starrii]|uniref:Deoxyribodipyrimidine photo-lyase n=1 Tax=Peredibacter starrii TaxID=28202 RepID=A0AAX4HSS0_9BACT|nr:deoxyribodipyrimidine photo-lyase [Peredibacter starrii]WPU66441.1 deoxyribodipyrimidine photo-lyase [Peredibacter starrii]